MVGQIEANEDKMRPFFNCLFLESMLFNRLKIPGLQNNIPYLRLKASWKPEHSVAFLNYYQLSIHKLTKTIGVRPHGR